MPVILDEVEGYSWSTAQCILASAESRSLSVYFFFFQAEDGIRDHCETGVQTCALPICGERSERRHGDVASVRLDLGDVLGSVRIGVGHLVVEPGKLSYPPHCHSAEEELD